MEKMPVFISNGLLLLLKNLLVVFQVPFSQHLGRWHLEKNSVYHFGHVGNDFVTLCFSSALRFWKTATPEDEAQKGLIHVENIHFFHIFIDGQDHRVRIHRPYIAAQLYPWWKPRGGLAHWSCVLTHKEDVPTEGVEASLPHEEGWQEGISIYSESRSLQEC